MAVMATDSLSYPPPMERIRCDGMTDMTREDAAAARQEPDTSCASRPSTTVAMEPNHAGTNTHTSFSFMRMCVRPRYCPHSGDLSTFQMATLVNCMPG